MKKLKCKDRSQKPRNCLPNPMDLNMKCPTVCTANSKDPVKNTCVCIQCTYKVECALREAEVEMSRQTLTKLMQQCKKNNIEVNTKQCKQKPRKRKSMCRKKPTKVTKVTAKKSESTTTINTSIIPDNSICTLPSGRMCRIVKGQLVEIPLETKESIIPVNRSTTSTQNIPANTVVSGTSVNNSASRILPIPSPTNTSLPAPPSPPPPPPPPPQPSMTSIASVPSRATSIVSQLPPPPPPFPSLTRNYPPRPSMESVDLMDLPECYTQVNPIKRKCRQKTQCDTMDNMCGRMNQCSQMQFMNPCEMEAGNPCRTMSSCSQNSCTSQGIGRRTKSVLGNCRRKSIYRKCKNKSILKSNRSKALLKKTRSKYTCRKNVMKKPCRRSSTRTIAKKARTKSVSRLMKSRSKANNLRSKSASKIAKPIAKKSISRTVNKIAKPIAKKSISRTASKIAKPVTKKSINRTIGSKCMRKYTNKKCKTKLPRGKCIEETIEQQCGSASIKSRSKCGSDQCRSISESKSCGRKSTVNKCRANTSKCTRKVELNCPPYFQDSSEEEMPCEKMCRTRKRKAKRNTSRSCKRTSINYCGNLETPICMAANSTPALYRPGKSCKKSKKNRRKQSKCSKQSLSKSRSRSRKYKGNEFKGLITNVQRGLKSANRALGDIERCQRKPICRKRSAQMEDDTCSQETLPRDTDSEIQAQDKVSEIGSEICKTASEDLQNCESEHQKVQTPVKKQSLFKRICSKIGGNVEPTL